MVYTQGQENFSVDRGLQELFSPDIGRLKLDANIVLGDFILNTLDSEGVVWVVTDIPGWWEAPRADVPDIPRGFGDGSYEVRGRYNSRSFSIRGSFLVPKPSLVEAARDRLIAATANLARTGVWFKTGSDPIRAAYVTLNGDISIETENLRGRTNFEIGLRAADPIKYAWNDASPDGYAFAEVPVRNSATGVSGLGTITNIGNYSVPCFLEVSGPFAGPGTIFNRATEELIILTQGLKGPISRTVVNKQLTFNLATLKDIATLTTTEAHGFSVGDSVYVSGIDAPFDGDNLITAVPTDTTFNYEADAASIIPVAFKSLSAGFATIKTTEPHGLVTGSSVVVNGVDSVFDGVHTITSTPAANSLQFSKTRIPPRSVISASLISNIATINTSDVHQFILGETVTITGVGTNYNGTFEVTAIPSPTSFSYASTRTNARTIIKKQMVQDTVFLTTSAPHGFVPGENVNVTGVDLSLNGGYTIGDTPIPTDFSYRRVRTTQKTIVTKARSNNVATLTASQSHGFVVGEKVVVEGAGSGNDGDFNGTHTITSLPSSTTFTYANSGSNQVSTTIPTGGTARAGSRKIASILLAGNVITITTRDSHGAIFGEQITITGVGAPFDGTYTISAIPFLNVLECQKTAANVALISYPVDEETGATADVFVELSGTISLVNVTPNGQAEVGGSLPLTATGGTATISDTIPETFTGGNVIKTQNVQFTPGLSGATAIVSADILEIDTQNREVAFNGEVEGARGRVDVLANFIKLAPGDNELEFIDSGNPEGETSLRVYYRSGWLG
jgi:hypothetical protein